jgi:hypothetical protein
MKLKLLTNRANKLDDARRVRMKKVEKLNRFLLLRLNTKMKMKVKTVKPNTKTNANLRNIENFENEPIRAKLCRTRLVYENLIWNADSQCITINKCHGGKFRVQESRLINLVSFIREKRKRKKKKEEKKWDAFGTRLERIATRPDSSCSFSLFVGPVTCSATTTSREARCSHAAPCKVISFTSTTQGCATARELPI